MAEQKKILLTGASSGFGALVLERLLKSGAHVYAVIRGGESRVRSLRPQLADFFGKTLWVGDFDLKERGAPERLLEDFRAKTGSHRLDALILNAGFGVYGPAEELSAQSLRDQMEVNFFSAVELTQLALSDLRASRGRVIAVSSLVGRFSLPYYGAYAASKHALEGWFEALDFEVRRYGVRVHLIEPGGFRTEFTRQAGLFAELPSQSPYLSRFETFKKVIAASEPRLGNPKRIAALILKLMNSSWPAGLRQPRGFDSAFLHLIGWVFPDFARRWLMRQAFRLVV